MIPILLTYFAGIMAADFIYSIPNLNFYKSQKVGKYYIYEKGSLLSGRYLILYGNEIIFKRIISTQREYYSNYLFKDANKFEIISENKDFIEIKYFNDNQINQIVFKK